MRLKEKKVISLVHHECEDLELWYPILRLREEGAIVHLAGEKANETYIGKYGVPAESDFAFGDINPEEYDALLVPGGWAPDKLRRFPEVLALVQHMEERKKANWSNLPCGLGAYFRKKILEGKKVTSTPGIRDDMEKCRRTMVGRACGGRRTSCIKPPSAGSAPVC
ncbi:type 1 glutamine amidotransferase domain-containing protein [Ectobacillus funiculus]